MKVRQITTIALFIALSTVGAFIKIPSSIGSVALDSFPSLIAAVVLGPIAGAITAAMGHIISAIMSGMPLGPLHFIIMLEMAVLAWTFGTLYKAGKKNGAALLFFIGNTLIAPLPFITIISWGFYVSMLIPLLFATVINLVVAVILLPKLIPLLGKIVKKDVLN